MDNQLTTIQKRINSPKAMEHFRKVLPSIMTPDRFARVALSQLTKNPKLQECKPESIIMSIMDCAELGLEPDGRRAHLIPYKNLCKLVIDYKGLVELAKRNGNISLIHADVVCDNDIFSYKNGQVNHEIDFRKERGRMYAVYAYVRYKDGTEQYEVMSRSEVDKVRDDSPAGKYGPWVTHYHEMSKKTVFRRLAKWLTMSPQYLDAFDKDYDTINMELKNDVNKFDEANARRDGKGNAIPKINQSDVNIISELLNSPDKQDNITDDQKLKYINGWLERRGGYPVESINELSAPEGKQLIFDLLNDAVPEKKQGISNQELNESLIDTEETLDAIMPPENLPRTIKSTRKKMIDKLRISIEKLIGLNKADRISWMNDVLVVKGIDKKINSFTELSDDELKIMLDYIKQDNTEK